MGRAAQQAVGADVHFRPGNERFDVFFKPVKVHHAHGVFFFAQQVKGGFKRLFAAHFAQLHKVFADYIRIARCFYAGDEDAVQPGKSHKVIPAVD